ASHHVLNNQGMRFAIARVFWINPGIPVFPSLRGDKGFILIEPSQFKLLRLSAHALLRDYFYFETTLSYGTLTGTPVVPGFRRHHPRPLTYVFYSTPNSRLIRIRLHRLYCREVCWHFSMERDGLNIVDLLPRRP